MSVWEGERATIQSQGLYYY